MPKEFGQSVKANFHIDCNSHTECDQCSEFYYHNISYTGDWQGVRAFFRWQQFFQAARTQSDIISVIYVRLVPWTRRIGRDSNPRQLSRTLTFSIDCFF